MDGLWILAGFVVGPGALAAPGAVALKFELLVLGDVDELCAAVGGDVVVELMGTNGAAIARSPVRLLGLF